jgi:hypothetical protein
MDSTALLEKINLINNNVNLRPVDRNRKYVGGMGCLAVAPAGHGPPVVVID